MHLNWLRQLQVFTLPRKLSPLEQTHHHFHKNCATLHPLTALSLLPTTHLPSPTMLLPPLRIQPQFWPVTTLPGRSTGRHHDCSHPTTRRTSRTGQQSRLRPCAPPLSLTPAPTRRFSPKLLQVRIKADKRLKPVARTTASFSTHRTAAPPFPTLNELPGSQYSTEKSARGATLE